jgi:HEPN domain-containing protein
MKCQADIEALAHEKLQDAECLLNNNRYDGAYYLAGYAVELLLKAKVCKTIGIQDFFDFSNPKKTKLSVKNPDILYKPYKVHDPAQLLILSGIYSEFQDDSSKDVNLKKHWSIVSKWDENSRYLTGITDIDVKNFIISIKEIMQWIQKYL